MADPATVAAGRFSKDQSSTDDNEKRTMPLAFSVGEAEVKEDVPFYRRHKCAFIFCAILLGLVVLLGILVLILAFTFFKPKQPVITINSVVLENLNIGNLSGIPPSVNLTILSKIAASVNLTLGVDVTVWNPNHAGFKYTNSTSYMFYRSTQVGEAPIPAGRIGARGTENLATELRLNASRVLSNPNLLPDLLAGSFPISTTAEVSGRVNILNVFKHHARSSSICTMSVSVASRSVQNMTCSSHVKL